ncbi:GNAT family N-acetyltransferase [Candidatus Bathyarchaeota archaeon]|nr:GNAT family N-acetyltransferase [Candidatus Bathyarchaeota archaeon]
MERYPPPEIISVCGLRVAQTAFYGLDLLKLTGFYILAHPLGIMSPERGGIRVTPMSIDHVDASAELFVSRYDAARKTLRVLPGTWSEDPAHVRSFLLKHVGDGLAYVAERGGEPVGYMAYDVFPFHGERKAFCPVLGHASVEAGRSLIYLELYRALSGHWVEDGVLGHFVTYFSDDAVLRDLFFGLGFGLYVVDCFGPPEPVAGSGQSDVREGSVDDLPELVRLGEESRRFYIEPPLFLVRDKQSREYYERLLMDGGGRVFIAEAGGRAVGFIYVRRNDEDDAVTLSPMGVGMIDLIGAYLEPDARGRGVGEQLLDRAFQWCRTNSVSSVHVDYESANPYASRFWPKHFTPVLHSVKRSVNRDIVSLHK